MIGIPGFSHRLFESLANEFINVILITQGSSEHSICVGIDEALADNAKAWPLIAHLRMKLRLAGLNRCGWKEDFPLLRWWVTI